MNDPKLQKLVAERDLRNQQIIGRLKELFPPNSIIRFHIMSGQVNDSTGRVAGYNADHGGHVNVEHDQAKARSRYKYRSVHSTQILGLLK